jgi:hypothetical protein
MIARGPGTGPPKQSSAGRCGPYHANFRDGAAAAQAGISLVVSSGQDVMPHTSFPATNRRPILISIFILLLVTALGVAMSTASNIALGEPKPASQTLTVDERTYYEFVAPRLDRLVVEIDGVVTMVEGKSRDILALTISGDRIEALTDEIVGYGEAHGVPSRFASVHDLIVGGTTDVTYIFDQARAALRRFDFSRITTLVSHFDSAAQTIHLAQFHMMTVVGTESALRAEN